MPSTISFFKWRIHVALLVPHWHASLISIVSFFVFGCSWCRNTSQHAESLLASPRSFAATNRSYQQVLGSSGILEWSESDAMGKDEMTPPKTHRAFRLKFLQLHILVGVFCLIQTWISQRLALWHCLMSWMAWWMFMMFMMTNLTFVPKKITKIRNVFSDFMNFHEHPIDSQLHDTFYFYGSETIRNHGRRRKCQRILRFMPGTAACLAGPRIFQGCTHWKMGFHGIYQETYLDLPTKWDERLDLIGTLLGFTTNNGVWFCPKSVFFGYMNKPEDLGLPSQNHSGLSVTITKTKDVGLRSGLWSRLLSDHDPQKLEPRVPGLFAGHARYQVHQVE